MAFRYKQVDETARHGAETLSTVTLSISIKKSLLSIMEEHCYAVVLFMLNVTYNHYMLSFIVPIFIILSFIKLSDILLSVIMLNVVMVNVVALPGTIKSTSFFVSQ